jgi:hypothetical protein
MGSADAYWGRIGPTFAALYKAEEVLLLLGFALLAWLTVRTFRRDRADQRYLILALWLVIPPLFWVRHSMPLYPHYFQTVVPTQFIALGLLLARVWDFGAGRRGTSPRPTDGGDATRHRSAARATDDAPTGSPFPRGEGGRGVRSVLRGAVALSVAALVVIQTYSLFAWMRQIGDGPTPPGYGVPLRDLQTVAERMVGLAATDNRVVYLAANGADYRSALEFLIGDRLKLKPLDDRDTFLAPPADGGETYYLASNPNRFAGAYLRQNFADRLVATVPHTSDDRQFEIYRLAGDDRARLLANVSTPLDRTLPNGIRFLGYTAPPTVNAGSKSTVTLYWQVVSRPPMGEDFGQFFHLVDDGGKAWAKIDGLNYSWSGPG